MMRLIPSSCSTVARVDFISGWNGILVPKQMMRPRVVAIVISGVMEVRRS